jgi:glycogen(starch) synthase
LAGYPRTRFVFVGRDIGDPARPSSSASLRKEAERLGIASAVEFPGELPWEGVLEELRRASVCVFPSRWECFPNVAAEAAAIGRPVVASSIPGFQELVQDGVTGRVVATDDGAAWAAAIVELLSDRDRARTLGGAASSLVHRVADPERIADATIAAYEDAIERWQRGQRAGRPRK